MIARITKPLKYLALQRICRDVAPLDLLWCPYATPDTTYAAPVPGAYTIHDLIPLHDPASSDRTHAKYEKMLNRASLTTISSCVRNEIASHCKKDIREISVIPNAVTVDTAEQQPIDGLKPKAFILDINAYCDRKNPITLLRAYEKIAGQTPLDLVFCGYDIDNYLQQFRSLAERSPYAGRIHLLSGLPQSQRNWLLTHCAVFVTPSLDEGFGRTPVEAAICRVPVLSTKCTSLYEATQGMVHYVEDPMNPDEYAEKLLDMIQHPDSPEKLAAISDHLKNAYSVESCAAAYFSFFQTAIQREGNPV